jgi:hypothetical protein
LASFFGSGFFSADFDGRSASMAAPGMLINPDMHPHNPKAAIRQITAATLARLIPEDLRVHTLSAGEFW